MKIHWDRIANATLVICAVLTTGVVVYKQLLAPAERPPAAASPEPVFVENWQAHLEKAVRLGPPDAAVKLIEFADFECPYCARFHEMLRELRTKYPEAVAVYFVHYPLEMHRFAEPAARAAECAGQQGRFEAMHDVLFTQQRSIGLKNWSEFAAEAGVADLSMFESCRKSTDPLPRVMDGRQLADELQVKGTPTLLVNGWKLGSPPGRGELERMVKAILSGQSPL